MDWWKRLFCTRGVGPALVSGEPEPFSLPSPIPRWPQGGGFATGRIQIGELEIVMITRFQCIWSYHSSSKKRKGATFYKPIGIPDGFCCLGHYAQPNDQPLHGFVLVAREAIASTDTDHPALQKPIDYVLIWSSSVCEDNQTECGYFWHPIPPNGYKVVGFVVTEQPRKPSLDEVRCVRADLTDECENHDLILNIESVHLEFPFQVWRTRPSHRGMQGKGVSAGTFFCGTCTGSEDELDIVCLKNVGFSLQAMPDLDQIHALIKHYGPTVFCHPNEIYLPSSVSWFFRNGATIHKKEEKAGEQIDADGLNLPGGGQNDGEYWIDLPEDDSHVHVKHGDMESAELYAHVKPALGGTFTDIAMWVFCPFNGPGTIRVGMSNFPLGKVGQHLGDWEHFTLRISNFTGELWTIYFSQHSGGEWVDASRLEFIEGNKAAVYSSRNGHASFPHPGCYLQGSQKLGIGIRNDAARSQLVVDSSTKYQIIAAEYLGDVVREPPWLQYMRQWGPRIVYNSKWELEKMVNYLPFYIRSTVNSIFGKLPVELYGEEGPTGPKEKNNWEGDERG